MNEIQIRAAFCDDAQIIAYIMIAAWRAAFTDIISPDMMDCCTRMDTREELVRNILSGGSHEGLICERNGSPCAVTIYENTSENACEIVVVHSVPSSWGSGCGHALMKETLAKIKKKGCTHAFLWVFCENRRARRFYEKCGFVPDGAEKDGSYGVREMRYVISLK